MASYIVFPGLVDEIGLTEYGAMTRFEAAELVTEDGTRAAVFLEPVRRAEPNHPGWAEAVWRADVREIARSLAYEGPLTLVWDPARDQQEEEPLD